MIELWTKLFSFRRMQILRKKRIRWKFDITFSWNIFISQEGFAWARNFSPYKIFRVKSILVNKLIMINGVCTFLRSLLFIFSFNMLVYLSCFSIFFASILNADQGKSWDSKFIKFQTKRRPDNSQTIFY